MKILKSYIDDEDDDIFLNNQIHTFSSPSFAYDKI